MGSQKDPDPWKIELRNITGSLRNLLIVYIVGLFILFIYISLLGIGLRILLERSIQGREVIMAIYGVTLTTLWLYGWWTAIKYLRKNFISRAG
jgi:positive regulator of sigma E activity